LNISVIGVDTSTPDNLGLPISSFFLHLNRLKYQLSCFPALSQAAEGHKRRSMSWRWI
jgi:hypothetical protein